MAHHPRCAPAGTRRSGAALWPAPSLRGQVAQRVALGQRLIKRAAAEQHLVELSLGELLRREILAMLWATGEAVEVGTAGGMPGAFIGRAGRIGPLSGPVDDTAGAIRRHPQFLGASSDDRETARPARVGLGEAIRSHVGGPRSSVAVRS
jgi:hypothetical protein